MVVDEKTPFQKVVTEWIFGQSTGLVMAVLIISIQSVCIYALWLKMEKLEIRVYDELKYQRTELKQTLDNNTKALNDNTNVIEKYFYNR